MILIGSRLSHDRDDTTGVLPVLCVVVARLHAELLQSIRKRKRLVDVAHVVDVRSAVEEVADLILPGAIRRDCNRGGEGFRRPLISVVRRSRYRTRNKRGELRGIPAIERQFHHAGRIDHLPERSGGRVDLCGARIDRHIFTGGSQHEPDIDRQALVRQKGDASLTELPEAWMLNVQRVLRRPKRS